MALAMAFAVALASIVGPLYFREISPMRPFYFIVLALLLHSCKGKKDAAGSGGTRDTLAGDMAAGDSARDAEARDFYKLDTTAPPEKIFYPVFELSPRTTAFVVLFSQTDRKGALDSIFDRMIHVENGAPAPDCEIFDTTGAYKLMRNEKLESAIKKRYSQEFYIYGTQGSTKASVKNIVFGLDECRSNIFAFCLDKASLVSIGHPLFCTDKKIDLRRGNNYGSAERAIGAWLSKIPADYDDSIKFKVLGNAGDFYFTYSDDFLWGKGPDGSKCKYPARSIYVVDGNNNVHQYWVEVLDLFGIGCD